MKSLLLILITYFCHQVVGYAQTSVVAGQVTGMRITRPNNLFFSCAVAPGQQCQQVDIDSDGSPDFDLAVELGMSIRTIVRSLAPSTWEVLNNRDTLNTTSNDAKPIQQSGYIGPAPLSGTWKPVGILCYNASYNGLLYLAGSWYPVDTLTRYVGIRKLQNGQWRYGYLRTKRMGMSSPGQLSPPIYITLQAIQSVITSRAQQQLAGVELYPNPVQSVLRIESPHAAWLRIYNAVGSLQHEEQLAAGITHVSVASWASGIYLLRLENENGGYVSRFQKTE